MTLQNWANNGWLRAHKTSKQEIKQLFEIVERDLKDAQQQGLSPDWRFGIAYNAALKLCTILLYASGYRPEKALAHYRTLQALPLILGPEKDADADYLDSCRSKRNIVEYDYTGGATDADAKELIAFVVDLKKEVIKWLKAKHPEDI
jgi:hypothetical protein